jgi:hypothetical protein
VRTWLTYL